MTDRTQDSDPPRDAVIDGIVDLRREDTIVNKTVTRFEDQIQVELSTELDDGTYQVSTFRFYVTRSGDTVVPKHEIDREFRLIVASALRNEGYELDM